MRIPAYLRLSRHGIYFFRVCIPVRLQDRWRSGRELKVSLRTRDHRIALARACEHQLFCMGKSSAIQWPVRIFRLAAASEDRATNPR